ncbi:NAD(P)-dependent oxidoreductase [bacterium]|nr:NAD(P)-dependent oxidoreductase [bacterium]
MKGIKGTNHSEAVIKAIGLGHQGLIDNVSQLDDILSEPPDYLVDALSGLDGDIMVLGAAGKMGPTMLRMAKRASEAAGCDRRVIGVSRSFSSELEADLNKRGIEIVRCDLLEPSQVAQLQDTKNVIFMVGMKFGTSTQQSLTWAINTYVPGLVAQRYRNSRIIAFSTGNVYGLKPIHLGGSVETDMPAPIGEYAMSALGRERVFEHFSRTYNIPLSIIRLNYACELRYGVLVDIARNVWAGKPVDLSMGEFNVIWQADACAMALAALRHAASPPFILNVAGPETLSIRRVAEQFAELMGKSVSFVNTECTDALLSNGQMGHRLYAYPKISAQQMIIMTADWIMRRGETIDKPTHFDVRDGRF